MPLQQNEANLVMAMMVSDCVFIVIDILTYDSKQLSGEPTVIKKVIDYVGLNLCVGLPYFGDVSQSDTVTGDERFKVTYCTGSHHILV